MPHQCGNCQSLFFKTLETRLSANGSALLYKKRCKRCKFKYALGRQIPHGALQPTSWEEWRCGRKVGGIATTPSERGRVFVSDYSEKVSRAADRTLGYLRKIQRADGSAFATPPQQDEM